MTKLDVEIRRLPRMVVAAAQATGPAPEEEAWRRLSSWAESAGVLEDQEAHPVYGFNNPPPEPDHPAYGYEFWIKLDEPLDLPQDLTLKEFDGGRYAVTTCRLHDDPRGTVPEVWQQLLAWVYDSPYRWRRTHELERLCNPGAVEEDVVLELYLPIEDD